MYCGLGDLVQRKPSRFIIVLVLSTRTRRLLKYRERERESTNGETQI